MLQLLQHNVMSLYVLSNYLFVGTTNSFQLSSVTLPLVIAFQSDVVFDVRSGILL